MADAARCLPTLADLPGDRWLELATGDADGSGGAGEVLDCVGPAFPAGEEVASVASSPHFLRPPTQLVCGLALVCAGEPAAERASAILSGEGFASCLGRAVGADLAADPAAAELLGTEVRTTAVGTQVRFTGASAAGVRPVVLDITVVRRGRALVLLWFGDTPEPFVDEDRGRVVEAVRTRLSSFPG